MEIIIKSNQKISEVQQAFSKAFPYLKLEFFYHKKKAVLSGLTSKRIRKESNTVIAEQPSNGLREDAVIQVVPGLCVSDLKRNFEMTFGLDVQLYRKSGDTWLETTLTDNWSLEQQNRQGEILSRQKKP